MATQMAWRFIIKVMAEHGAKPRAHDRGYIFRPDLWCNANEFVQPPDLHISSSPAQTGYLLIL